VCVRFIDALMFYALSLNAGRLPGSVFFNVFLLSVIEIPANVSAAFLLERVGRRPTLGVSTILGGLVSFLMIPLTFFSGQYLFTHSVNNDRGGASLLASIIMYCVGLANWTAVVRLAY